MRDPTVAAELDRAARRGADSDEHGAAGDNAFWTGSNESRPRQALDELLATRSPSSNTRV